MTEVIRVLYVDDDPALLDLARLLLEQGGEFVVDTLSSAPDALARLKTEQYDAIVSDYQMPEMDGITFLKHLKEFGDSTPFIIFTGRGREEVVIEALNNGADFYLQKGGNTGPLYKELRHVIQQSVLMKRTQMTLAEQEQRYHDLQNASDLIQSVAPDGHFLFVNKKWLETLGYEESELPNLTIFNIIHEESLQHCMETFQHVMAGESVGIIDAIFKTRDGRKVYVEGMVNCKVVKGQPQFTRGLFKDVTDRKQTEAALKESEARYRDVVEDQTEFISRFRPDGIHVFVNNAFCRYYHKTREAIIGHRFVTEIPKEEKERVRDHFASLTREHPVATISHRVILPDGRIRWQQWSNRAIFDDDGHLREYQSVGRDITDLKDAEYELSRRNEEINAAFEELTATEEELRQNYDRLSEKEQALRESEEKYRLLTEITDDVIYIIDVQGTVIHISPRISRYGYKPEEIISRNFTDFIAKEDVPHVLANFKKAISTRQSAVSTLRVRDKTGNLHWMEDNGALVFNSSGSVIALSGILRDVTDRTKAAEALRENEETFRAIVEQSGEGIIIVDFLGMLLFANDRAWEIIEYPPERRTIRGFNVMEIVASEMRVNALRDFLQVSRGIDSYPVTYKIITPDKKEKWIDCIGKKISYKGSTAMLLSVRDITDRWSKDRAVEENENKFRTIFENSPYPISINSIPDGKFIAVNEAFLKSSGYAETEVLGKTATGLGLLSLMDYGKLTSRLLVSGRIENVPMVLGGKDGARIHVQFSVIPVTINKRPAILTMATVVTKLKQTEEELQQKNQELAAAFEKLTASEEELRQNYDELESLQKTIQESEARFRTIFAISPDGIILFDITGKITYASPEAMRMFRVSSMDEALGTSVFEWVEPGYHEVVREAMVQLLDGTFQKSITYQVRRRDGSLFFVETSQGIFPNANGHPDGFVVIIRDITDRQRTETALRESEKNLRKIFENSAIGMTLALPDFRFQLVNPAWVSMMGYTEEEFRKMSFREITHPDDLSGDMENIRALAAGTIPVYSTEKRYIRKDGSTLWGALKVTPVRNQDGSLRNYLAQIEDITSRKQTEELLRESENKFATVFESSPVALTLVSAVDGTFVEVNDAFVRSTGYSREEVVGITADALGIFADSHERDRLFSALRKQQTVRDIEIKCREKTGEIRACLFSSSRILIGGKPHIFSNITDITERKRVEFTLQESENRFRTLLQHVPSVAVQGYAMDGTTQYWNDASTTLYGYTADEAVGKNLVDLIIPPEMKDDVSKAIAAMAESGEPIPASELSLMRKDGSRVSVFSSHAIVKNSTGTQELFCIDIDLTERRRIEEALRESEENFHAMFENHDSIMLQIEPESGRILDANRAAERFYGRTRNELRKLSTEDINALPPEVVAAEQAKAAQGQVTFFTFPHRIAGGEIRTVEVHSSPIALRGKTIIFSIIHDVTERRKVEEALQQANKKLNLLSGITRHDINNQLMALNGFVELLHRKIPEPSFENNFSHIIQASSQISKMITFTKEYEKIGVHAPDWQDLRTIVHNAGKDIALGEVMLKNDLPCGTEVFADPLIFKVVFNLIDNAIRHGGGLTTIRFSSEARNGERVIVCNDDGVGVPAEEKKRIFDRGFGKNTGLGLALSREILDITGIKIHETGDPGKGARFEVVVPKGMWRQKGRGE